MLRNTLIYLMLAVVAFVLLAWLFSDIFIYVAISIVLSAILRPLTYNISKAQFFKVRIPRIIAVVLSFAIFFLLIASFIVLFIPLISEQIEVLSRLDYESLYYRSTGPLKNLELFLIENDLTSEAPGFLVDSLKNNVQSFITDINFSNILNQLIAFTGQFFVGILAVGFISFFFLYEMGSMRNKLISLIPNRFFEVTIAAYNKIERLLSNYLVGLLIQMFSIFSIAALGLSIVGVKYALTIALFAAVANLIPYLGPILGASFGIIVGISTGLELESTRDYFFLIVKVISVFGVVQLVDNVFLQPLIFSKSVKAHPLEIFIIIFAGASLAGVVGMIAAIPVYTIIRVFVTELYQGYRSYAVFKIQKTQT
ncbi:MAG: AI-2E family transporter [Bacteroidota bacterium]